MRAVIAAARTQFGAKCGSVGRETGEMGGTKFARGSGEVLQYQHVNWCSGRLGRLGRHFSPYAYARVKYVSCLIFQLSMRVRETPSLASLNGIQVLGNEGKKVLAMAGMSLPFSAPSLPGLPWAGG